MRHELPVASAQVKTALLLAGLQADGDDRGRVAGAEPRSHRADARRAGRADRRRRARRVRVRARRAAPFELDVPGDPSSAAFFAVAAAITPGSDLVLEDVSCNPTRVGFRHCDETHGRRHRARRRPGEVCGEPVGELHVRASELHGTTIEGDEIPNVIDEIPALAIAAAFADGVTDIRDAAELVVKESNRIGTLHQELTRARASASKPRADGLVDPRRAAARRRSSRATATTASRWRWRWPPTRSTASRPCAGGARSRRRIPEFARRPRAAHRTTVQ